jgi:hypothetical protein
MRETPIGRPDSQEKRPIDIKKAIAEFAAQIAGTNPDEIGRFSIKGKDIGVKLRGTEKYILEFVDQKRRNTLMKVNFFETEQFLETRGVRKLNEEAKQALHERLNKKKTRLNENTRILCRYFGSAAIPAHRLFVADVPVVAELAERHPSISRLKPLPRTLPCLVYLERKIDLQNAIDLGSSMPEIRWEISGLTETIYNTAHHRLVGQEEIDDTESQKDAALVLYPKLKSVKEGMDTKLDDAAAFSASLRDLAEKLIRFTNETGMVLDLFGARNLVMKKKREEWKFYLLDPFLPWDVSLNDSRLFIEDISRQLSEGKTLAELSVEWTKKYNALFALNVVRFLNGLAAIAGIKDRVRIPALEKIDPSFWRSL